MGCGFPYPNGVYFGEPRLNRLSGIQASPIEKYRHVVFGWGPRRAHAFGPFNDCLRALSNHPTIVGE